MVRRDVVRIAQDWQARGRRLAIATVTQVLSDENKLADVTGIQLIVDSEGRFDGTLPGGTVSGLVIAEARRIIDSGVPELLEFGITPQMAWGASLTNPARIQVYVEPFALA